jgi:predicted metal-dependent phosphoesterase TrpH
VIDLHLHSDRSDGTDAPGRIAELAATAGCSAFALTDHDTLDGVAEARRRADELGLTAVPGCEMSCAFRGRGAHVLVYWVDASDGALADELVRLRADRVTRNRALVARLGELGIPVRYDEVVAEAAGEQSVGRPHVAAVLVRLGAADSIPDAFDRWLARGRPAHVPKARLAVAEAAALARGAGGVAVLAHPLSLGLGPAELDAAVAQLAGAGLAGLEARYARYDRHQRAALSTLARRHGLVPTGGSDYHGTVKAGLAVGVGRGDLCVPDDTLTDLAARRPA